MTAHIVSLESYRLSDAELEEQLVMDASVWKGIKNAILPSLAMWALIGLGVELARAFLP